MVRIRRVQERMRHTQDSYRGLHTVHMETLHDHARRLATYGEFSRNLRTSPKQPLVLTEHSTVHSVHSFLLETTYLKLLSRIANWNSTPKIAMSLLSPRHLLFNARTNQWLIYNFLWKSHIHYSSVSYTRVTFNTIYRWKLVSFILNYQLFLVPCAWISLL